MKKITFQLITALFFLLLTKATVAQNINFTESVTQGCASLTVTFTYVGTNPNTNRIDWYFNDGTPMVSTTLPVKTVTHTFTAGYWNPYIFVYDINNIYVDQTYSSAGGIESIGAPTISSLDSTCTNEGVDFQANGQTNSLSWNFGDGTTSTDTYPQHAYTTIGTKTVTLTANTSCGNFTVTKKVYVVNTLKPLPIIYTDASGSICPNAPVNFQTNKKFLTYSWNFGDGNTSNLQYPLHAYTTVGTKTITLTVTNGCGKLGTAKATVTVANNLGFPNGTAIGSYSPKYCPGEEAQGYVNGSGSSSYPKYVWNFGDASPKDSTSGSYYRHTFFTVGTYTVSCKITNYCGKDSTFFNIVNVSNNVFFPNSSWFKIDVNSSPTCPNSTVGFNAPSGYNNYQWNFGDGSPLTTTTNGYSNHTYGSTLTSYTLSVKITNLCGKDTTLYSTLKISNPAAFPNNSNFKLNVYESPACPNSNINFNAPYGYDNYEWNFGDGSPLLTSTNSSYNHTYGNKITTYTVSVKITDKCGNDSILYAALQILSNVPFPNQSWFKLQGPSNAVCPGDEVNWNAPSGYINYAWTFGDGNSESSSNGYLNHSYLTVGTYTASVKITNACGKDTTISGSIVVSASGLFSNNMSINISPSACVGDLVNFRFSGGNFKSYFWTFGDGDTLTTYGNNIQHSYLSTGIYYASCKIKNGCGNTTTLNTTVQVTNNSPINSSLDVTGVQNPSCIGDKVFFIMKSGQANYKYAWDFGDGTKDTTVGSGSSHVFKTAGSHTVTIIATNSCGLSKTISMVEVISTGVTPSLRDSGGSKNWGYPGGDDNGSATTAGCSGDAIVFYFMGDAANNLWDFGDGNTGTAIEKMLIYGGDGAFPVTIIKHSYATNGPYKVKLTITNNCGKSATDSMNIIIGGNQAVNGDMTTSPPPYTTCSSVDFLAFGGSTYGWNFGDGSSTINTSSPTISHTFSTQGVFLISVLITNGCGNKATYSRSVNVNGVGGPSVSLNNTINPTCVNDHNGSATVSVSSGQPPYIYSWNDASGQTSATATGLSAGLYNATVTDNIGCKSVLAVSIANPVPIVLQVLTTTTSCGGATGTASVSTSSGGTAPFTYQWSTGAVGALASGLSSRSYSVVGTDSKGCTSSLNVSISESGGATLSVNSSTNVSCYGSTSGAIDINVTGGTAPYIYLWSNGSTTQDITGLSAGNYSVLVTDKGGCKANINKSITQSTVIVVNASVSKSPTCGNFDGNATSSPTGGTAPYTYLWDANAASQTTKTATGLPAGTYSVTVTDGKGCMKQEVISLSNSNAPNINANQTNVSCNGGSNGGIDITVTGGTSPYLYTWNVGPPQTNTQDLTGLLPGNYLVFVQDSKNCLSVRSYTISQPAILITTVTTTGATCSTNNGTALASASGGNIPYSYAWSGGQTTQTATSLSQGSYTVTVTDNKGCTAKATSAIAVSAPNIDICLVTVDTLSVNNIIYWDKTSYSHIDSFIIYREVSTAIYKRIGAVKDTAFTAFIDTARSIGPANGNPNIGTYRYKIQLLDSCGNYSALSPYHNTVYVDVNIITGAFTWNQYLIENMVNPPVSNNNLICDTTTGWWTIGSVAGTQTILADPQYLSRPAKTKWRVETSGGLSCTPTRDVVNTTRSNIKNASAIIGVKEISLWNDYLQIYPNPVFETLTIQYSGEFTKCELQIVDALGQLVYNETLLRSPKIGYVTQQIDVSTFRKGIYIINLKSERGNSFKRLVIQ